MTQQDKYRILSIEENTELQAEQIPDGRVWENKVDSDSTMGKLVKGLSAIPRKLQEQIKWLRDEFNIYKSRDLLPDWEKSVGLPDDCLGEIEDIEQRRAYVIARFKKTPVVTIEELREVFYTFFPDTDIKLYPGIEYYSFERTFEQSFGWGDYTRFVIVIVIPVDQEEQFEYEFEHEFVGGPNVDNMRCFLRQFVPANVSIAVEYQL